jgi:hypothetical protein
LEEDTASILCAEWYPKGGVYVPPNIGIAGPVLFADRKKGFLAAECTGSHTQYGCDNKKLMLPSATNLWRVKASERGRRKIQLDESHLAKFYIM